MFKQTQASDELAEFMSRNLLGGSEDIKKVDSIDEAFGYLEKAAEIFDDIGLTVEAEVVTKIMEKISG